MAGDSALAIAGGLVCIGNGEAIGSTRRGRERGANVGCFSFCWFCCAAESSVSNERWEAWKPGMPERDRRRKEVMEVGRVGWRGSEGEKRWISPIVPIRALDGACPPGRNGGSRAQGGLRACLLAHGEERQHQGTEYAACPGSVLVHLLPWRVLLHFFQTKTTPPPKPTPCRSLVVPLSFPCRSLPLPPDLLVVPKRSKKPGYCMPFFVGFPF